MRKRLKRRGRHARNRMERRSAGTCRRGPHEHCELSIHALQPMCRAASGDSTRSAIRAPTLAQDATLAAFRPATRRLLGRPIDRSTVLPSRTHSPVALMREMARGTGAISRAPSEEAAQRRLLGICKQIASRGRGRKQASSLRRLWRHREPPAAASASAAPRQ